MSTLDELLYYCQEENSFGALMLTGRWGCGKTFLIEHDLAEKLGDAYIVLRISLFGVASIDAINKAVQKKYFEAVMQNAGDYFALEQNKKQNLSRLFAKTKKVVATANGKTKLSTFLTDVVKCFPGMEKILSLDPSDYFPVETRIGEKTIILVFDDLERTDINEIKVLGSINEYCENQHFKTIIVANEDKLRAEETQSQNEAEGNEPDTGWTKQRISYNEIKEKIISRTIKCSPNYEHIIAQILQAFIDEEGDYKKFLLEHTEDIVNVFIEGKSENIRSLKCAIQDYYRIYKLLMEYDLSLDLKMHLCSFLAFVLCCKEGDIEKSPAYGYLFSDSAIRKKYPLYYRNDYMLYSVKDWVQNGEWHEQEVRAEIQKKVEEKKAPTPDKIVRAYPLISINEETIEKGLPVVIEDAYAGRLSIDEYIILLQNIAWARQMSYDLPAIIDIKHIREGVKICLDKMTETDEHDTKVRSMISDESKKLLLPKEAEVYDLICRFRDDNVQMFAINRRAYLTALSMMDTSNMYQCENKRFNLFDKEMARAVTEFYMRLPNADRQAFNCLFRKMWEHSCTSQDLQKPQSISGFELLKGKLERNRRKELEEKHQLRAALTKMLIQTVDQTIKNLNEAIEPKM